MNLRQKLLSGLVIPAHPLALTAERKLDERRQRALTRYYMSAGAGGIAVGVHTTQFAIRDPKFALFQPVLELAMEEIRGNEAVKIAGVCGRQSQAQEEAELAAGLGYDAALLSLADLRDQPVATLLDHARSIASTIPIIGFYLQTSIGGCVLPYEFWREMAEIENLVAIKIAPFNRYQTLEVIRAVADSGRAQDIALYTGNDDHILLDLLSEFDFGGERIRFAGGLLGQWAVWTRAAVRQVERVKHHSNGDLAELIKLAQQLTDANASLFDPAHDFRGCIPGIHEILRRQGLLEGRWCLDPHEGLSPGQSEEIDRVCRLYPHLTDDTFVQEHLDEWLS
jgi:dihydrodipicolinate synthase/N-acetylneuraminate lyase